mmetsp:Transcript_44986/g.115037  ORF Transcript_44986/g.115037 Transcript_44986/m.115037 type:complete len:499 (-) Transcript_44986:732-2228(-)
MRRPRSRSPSSRPATTSTSPSAPPQRAPCSMKFDVPPMESLVRVSTSSMLPRCVQRSSTSSGLCAIASSSGPAPPRSSGAALITGAEERLPMRVTDAPTRVAAVDATGTATPAAAAASDACCATCRTGTSISTATATLLIVASCSTMSTGGPPPESWCAVAVGTRALAGWACSGTAPPSAAEGGASLVCGARPRCPTPTVSPPLAAAWLSPPAGCTTATAPWLARGCSELAPGASAGRPTLRAALTPPTGTRPDTSPCADGTPVASSCWSPLGGGCSGASEAAEGPTASHTAAAAGLAACILLPLGSCPSAGKPGCAPSASASPPCCFPSPASWAAACAPLQAASGAPPGSGAGAGAGSPCRAAMEPHLRAGGCCRLRLSGSAVSGTSSSSSFLPLPCCSLTPLSSPSPPFSLTPPRSWLRAALACPRSLLLPLLRSLRRPAGSVALARLAGAASGGAVAGAPSSHSSWQHSSAPSPSSRTNTLPPSATSPTSWSPSS